jgi:hypothetical protein
MKTMSKAIENKRATYPVGATADRERARAVRVVDSWLRYLTTHIPDRGDIAVRILTRVRTEVGSGYDPERDRVDIKLT